LSYETLLYDATGPIARITLNRPDRLNAIVPPMPDEFEAAVREATLDGDVKAIVLRGAGRSFCAGYDFAGGFHHWDDALTTDGRWDPGKDFALAASPYGPTQKFMSIWRTPKPVIAQVHGWCVGGGSDMALCADLIIAAEDAQIGTPYSRVWGCYLSGEAYENLGLRATQTLGPIPRRFNAQHARRAGLRGGGTDRGGRGCDRAARRAVRRLQRGRPGHRPPPRSRARHRCQRTRCSCRRSIATLIAFAIAW
jgi:enoyl-CoA hydratase